MRIVARQAGQDDITRVADLWLAAQRWLHLRGEDQWQYPIRMDNISAALADKTCWLFEDNRETVATVTLDDFGDPTLWHATDRPDDALYVHRLVVARDQTGHQLGSAILDWAGRRARTAGKNWLRLDAWTSNADLHKYYSTAGFEHVRTVTGNGIPSGVLFQRPAELSIGLGPAVSE